MTAYSKTGFQATFAKNHTASAVVFDNLFALHGHAGLAAARILDSPFVQCEHLDQHGDHAPPSVVELFKHRCVSGVVVDSPAWALGTVRFGSHVPSPSRFRLASRSCRALSRFQRGLRSNSGIATACRHSCRDLFNFSFCRADRDTMLRFVAHDLNRGCIPTLCRDSCRDS